MRKLLPFFLCLMLVLTGWTGVAHATENGACLDAPQAQTAMHAAGDCDEVPADADKGYRHHHAACHGHCVTAPAESPITVSMTGAWVEFESEPTSLGLAHQDDPALRPPQA